jgi:hypothetical protein
MYRSTASDSDSTLMRLRQHRSSCAFCKKRQNGIVSLCRPFNNHRDFKPMGSTRDNLSRGARTQHIGIECKVPVRVAKPYKCPVNFRAEPLGVFSQSRLRSHQPLSTHPDTARTQVRLGTPDSKAARNSFCGKLDKNSTGKARQSSLNTQLLANHVFVDRDVERQGDLRWRKGWAGIQTVVFIVAGVTANQSMAIPYLDPLWGDAEQRCHLLHGQHTCLPQTIIARHQAIPFRAPATVEMLQYLQ